MKENGLTFKYINEGVFGKVFSVTARPPLNQAGNDPQDLAVKFFYGKHLKNIQQEVDSHMLVISGESKHPGGRENILDLLGVYNPSETLQNVAAVVTPKMSGTLTEFIRSFRKLMEEQADESDEGDQKLLEEAEKYKISTLNFAHGMFNGLAYMHGKDVRHGDIKPDNILLNVEKKKVVLCDFGASQAMPTSTEGFFGSSLFVSVDYVKSGKPKIFHDVYSAAVVVLLMLELEVKPLYDELERFPSVAMIFHFTNMRMEHRWEQKMCKDHKESITEKRPEELTLEEKLYEIVCPCITADGDPLQSEEGLPEAASITKKIEELIRSLSEFGG